MLGGLAPAPLSAAREREEVVRVARVLVASERALQVLGRLVILSRAQVRKPQLGVSGRKAGVAAQRFREGRAQFDLLALLRVREPLDVCLLGAARNGGVG